MRCGRARSTGWPGRRAAAGPGAALLVALLAACEPTGPRAVVAGHVTSDAGDPIAGAHVRLDVSHAPCRGDRTDASYTTRTDAVGRFTETMNGTREGETCIGISVTPPDESGTAGGEFHGYRVRFRPRALSAETLAVRLTLPVERGQSRVRQRR